MYAGYPLDRPSKWPLAIIMLISILWSLYLFEKAKQRQNLKNAEMRKAVHIDTEEMFRYGMETDVGNAFVYGELAALDPVSVPELDGEYYCIEDTEEEYRENTRVVTKQVYCDGKYDTEQQVETYYEWQTVSVRTVSCTRISFMGIEFPCQKIPKPAQRVAGTVGNGIKRHIYTVSPARMKGTVYTFLGGHTIADGSKFFENCSPDEALEKNIKKLINYDAFTAILPVVIGASICLMLWPMFYI